MSYCRWSSDDFQCDVYVYEAEDGIAVHVASQRVVLPEGGMPPLPDITHQPGQWLAVDRQRKQILEAADHRPIGLSRDGRTFDRLEPGEAADLLADLAAEGYNVPGDVIATLREEHTEQMAPHAEAPPNQGEGANNPDIQGTPLIRQIKMLPGTTEESARTSRLPDALAFAPHLNWTMVGFDPEACVAIYQGSPRGR